jgi:hypothetical protein
MHSLQNAPLICTTMWGRPANSRIVQEQWGIDGAWQPEPKGGGRSIVVHVPWRLREWGLFALGECAIPKR